MDLQHLKQLVQESGNIVFFGGAGTSTESDIPDFRSANGLYQTKSRHRYPPETMLSRDFFMRHTEEFYEFYRTRMIYKDAKPNAAHAALAALEREGRLKAVITQNIDGLHQMAGSVNVLELHGSVHRNHCMDCGAFYSLDDVLAAGGGDAGAVPRCSRCGGVVKPDVVLYQEELDRETLNRAIRHIEEADVFIVAGTSLTVYPAAGLVRYYRGNKLILINKSPTAYDGHANYVLQESIGKVMSAFIEP